MNDDLHGAYSANESRIEQLCNADAVERNIFRFSHQAWYAVSCVAGIIIAALTFYSFIALYTLPMFVVPFWEIRRAKKRLEEKTRAIGIQLDRCFHMRSYLRSQMRGF